MVLFPQRMRERRGLLSSALLAVCMLSGCANPGPPRAPSLFFPSPPKRITAERLGDTVELRFTAPSRSTDGLPLRASTLSGSLCRAVENSPCVAVGKYTVVAKDAHGQPSEVVWRDALPVDLSSGEPRVLSYRVSFTNPKGVSGPPSDSAYARPPAPLRLRCLAYVPKAHVQASCCAGRPKMRTLAMYCCAAKISPQPRRRHANIPSPALCG